MTHQSPVMDLLSQGVPLSLLMDLAGLGSTSQELYRTETTRQRGAAVEPLHPVAAAS